MWRETRKERGVERKKEKTYEGEIKKRGMGESKRERETYINKRNRTTSRE